MRSSVSTILILLLEADAFGRQVLGHAQVPWWRSQSYYRRGGWRGTWRLNGRGGSLHRSPAMADGTGQGHQRVYSYTGAPDGDRRCGCGGAALYQRGAWDHQRNDRRVLGTGSAPGGPLDAASVASNPAAQSAASHALQIADMIRAIREGGTPLVDGSAACRPVEIILAIYESSRCGREVVLPCFISLHSPMRQQLRTVATLACRLCGRTWSRPNNFRD